MILQSLYLYGSKISINSHQDLNDDNKIVKELFEDKFNISYSKNGQNYLKSIINSMNTTNKFKILALTLFLQIKQSAQFSIQPSILSNKLCTQKHFLNYRHKNSVFKTIMQNKKEDQLETQLKDNDEQEQDKEYNEMKTLQQAFKNKLRNPKTLINTSNNTKNSIVNQHNKNEDQLETKIKDFEELKLLTDNIFSDYQLNIFDSYTNFINDIQKERLQNKITRLNNQIDRFENYVYLKQNLHPNMTMLFENLIINEKNQINNELKLNSFEILLINYQKQLNNVKLNFESKEQKHSQLKNLNNNSNSNQIPQINNDVDDNYSELSEYKYLKTQIEIKIDTKLKEIDKLVEKSKYLDENLRLDYKIYNNILEKGEQRKENFKLILRSIYGKSIDCYKIY